MVEMLKSGRDGLGSPDGMTYLSLMMSVCQPHVLAMTRFATVARIMTISEPGILFVTLGHKKIITRQTAAIAKEYQFIVLKK